jgi:hypothetical protein
MQELCLVIGILSRHATTASSDCRAAPEPSTRGALPATQLHSRSPPTQPAPMLVPDRPATQQQQQQQQQPPITPRLPLTLWSRHLLQAAHHACWRPGGVQCGREQGAPQVEGGRQVVHAAGVCCCCCCQAASLLLLLLPGHVALCVQAGLAAVALLHGACELQVCMSCMHGLRGNALHAWTRVRGTRVHAHRGAACEADTRMQAGL